MRGGLALLCTFLGVGPAALAAPRAGLQLSLGLDSNPARTFSSSLPAATLQVEGHLGGARTFETFGGVTVVGDLASGVTGASSDPGTSTLAHRGTLGLSLPLSPGLFLESALGGTDVRRRLASHTELEVALGTRLLLPLTHVALEITARRFLFWPELRHASGGPGVRLSASRGLAPEHTLRASGGWELQRFRAPRRGPDGPDGLLPGLREDALLSARLGHRYRGSLLLDTELAYVQRASNSTGESLHRVRLAVSLAAPLPHDWTLVLRGALGHTSYPDGVYLSAERQLATDSESADELSLELSRPLFTGGGDGVAGGQQGGTLLVLGAGVWRATLPENGLSYVRALGTVGFAFELW